MAVKYQDIISELANYRRILVCGPHRSGTRLTASAIAHDLSYKYFDEKDYDWANYEKATNLWLFTEGKFVVHGPGLTVASHLFGSFKDGAVVCCIRPIVDIILSQARINWTGSESETAEWKIYTQAPLLPGQDRHYTKDDAPISSVKYKLWQIQKKYIHHYYEVDYSSLRSHPLWVNENERDPNNAWLQMKRQSS